MNKKTHCPSCGAIIEIDESQEHLHCVGCGKNYKNPYYKSVEVCKEVQNTVVADSNAYIDDSLDANNTVEQSEIAEPSETIEQNVAVVEEIADAEIKKRETIKKKLAKSSVAILILSSVLFIVELALMCYFEAILALRPIRQSSVGSFIVATVCFIASLVVFFNRKNICDADKTSLIIAIIVLCIKIVICILFDLIFAANTVIGAILFIVRYSIIISVLVLSAVNLKNIKPFIPKYVAPTHLDGHSEFNAGLLSLIWLNFVNNLIISFTFGLCTPWALRRKYTWLYEHQVIDEKKLVFDGTAASLFGQWIKWFLLSVVTLGIYAFFVPIKKMQWITKNTHIQNSNADTHDSESVFDGKFWSYWGMRFVNALIIVFSLGICAPWAIVREQRWFAEHRLFDGQRLVFDGSAIGLFGQWIKWLLLGVITLGVYAWWIPIKKQKWITAHTHFAICA